MRVPKITCLNLGIPYPYGRLTDKARLAIAMQKSTLATSSQIARVLGIDDETFVIFMSRIASDQEGRTVLSMGVPAMWGEQLPDGETAVCRHCGSRIYWVPCVSCCGSKVEYLDRIDKQTEERFRPTPPFSTDELPGTIDKIEVLRQRVRDGFGLWHPDDATVPD